MNIKNIKGFTLVELIIVLTILGLLSAIGFLSLQGYSQNSRDTNRLVTMESIENGLNLFFSRTMKYPDPENKTEIQASGTTIGYQGKIGENVSNMILFNDKPVDPLDGREYVYYVNSDSDKFQIMGLLEKETTLGYFLVKNTYAADNSARIPRVKGSSLGIILDSQKEPISGTKLDIRNTNSNYIIYFSNDDSINSNSGLLMFSNIYNRRSDLISKDLGKMDDSLVGYWDMETLTGGKLKDFSKYGNDGTLIGGIVVGGVQGVKGKGTYFDGVDDIINIGKPSSLSISGSMTVIATVKADADFTSEVGFFSRYGGSGYNWALRNYTGQFKPIFTVDSYNGNDFNVFGKNKLGNGFFYQLVGVHDTSTTKASLYINSIFDNSFDVTNRGFNNGSDVIIGGQDRNGFKFKGTIDEVRIYSRALSELEIKSLYNINNK